MPHRRLQHLHRQIHAAREDGHAIHALRGRRHAARADQPARGLEPHDVVETGRHAPGPGGIGAQGKVDLSSGHDVGGAGTRSAAHIGRVKGIGNRAVRRAGAIEAAGELVQVGFADQGCAGVQQLVDHRRMGGRHEAEGRAGCRCGQAVGVDVVLGGKAQTGQRTLGDGLQRRRKARNPGVRIVAVARPLNGPRPARVG